MASARVGIRSNQTSTGTWVMTIVDECPNDHQGYQEDHGIEPGTRHPRRKTGNRDRGRKVKDAGHRHRHCALWVPCTLGVRPWDWSWGCLLSLCVPSAHQSLIRP